LDTIAKANGASLHLNSLLAEKQITPHGARVSSGSWLGAQGAGGSHRNSKALASAKKPSDKQCGEAEPSSAADARVAFCRLRPRYYREAVCRAPCGSAISLSATVGYAA